jgi:hypothetical protein
VLESSVLVEGPMPGAFDPVAYVRAKEARRVKVETAAWLRGFWWDCFATATWESQISFSSALSIVSRWVSARPGAYAVAGVQSGPSLLKVHAHVLIGGLGRGRDGEAALRASWVTKGHVRVEAFRASMGGVEYLVDQAEDWQIIGSLMRYRPRARGRRGKRNGSDSRR